METHGSGKNRSTRLVSYEHFGRRKELVARVGIDYRTTFPLPVYRRN